MPESTARIPRKLRGLRPAQSLGIKPLQLPRIAEEKYAQVRPSSVFGSRNPFRVRALEELAKHYEHRERNHSMALEMTRTALAFEDTPPLRRREERLKGRIVRPRPGIVT